MNYVNWYNYMKNPYEISEDIIKNKIPENSTKWQDLITENTFFLTSEEKERIIKAASEFINKNLKDETFEQLFDYLSGRFELKDLKKLNISNCFDLWLFPQMPYGLTGQNIKNPRLMDFFNIRTGLLYASVSGEKEELRLISYLSALKEYLNEETVEEIDSLLMKFKTDEIEEALCFIDSALKNTALTREQKEKLDSYKFDIVKGGAVKVKQYFLETNEIKDIRGASMLLDNINRVRIPAYIKNNFIQESIIYAGGGNIFAIVKSGYGESLAVEIEKTYEEVTITAQNVAVCLSGISLLDISEENYKQTLGRLQDSINDRQMSKIDFRVDKFEGNINYNCEGEKDKIDINESNKYNDELKRCSNCRIRRATHKIGYKKDEEKYLCVSCLHKNKVGGKEGRESFKRDFIDYAKEHDIEIDTKENINLLSDIKTNDSNTIGIIYGDGNNMGAVIQNVKNLLQMRYFSEKTEKSIYGAVYGAIMEEMRDNTFEIIAIGGDDIFIIVPGKKALGISRCIGERFDNVFKNYSEDKFAITMSLGIAIAKNNKPVQYLFDLSMQLLKTAKAKSKEVHSGTMDIMVLETDASFASTVKFIRNKLKKKDNSKEIINTLRPYTWSEFKNVEDAIKKLKEKGLRSKAYNYMNFALERSMDEGNLYYSYQFVRADGEKGTFNEVFNSLGKNEFYESIPMSMYLKKKDKYYSPWLDIVELWDYTGE